MAVLDGANMQQSLACEYTGAGVTDKPLQATLKIVIGAALLLHCQQDLRPDMGYMVWAVVHLHKLIMQDSVRGGAGSLQELVQTLSWAVVHTVGAQHIQLLQLQILLH